MALDVSKAIYSLLKADSTLIAQIGTRIAPQEARESWIQPYLTYFIVTDPPTHAMGSDPTIGNPRVQIDTWAGTYGSARSVAKKVRGVLRDYQGTVTVSSTALIIQRIFYEGQVEMKETDLEDNTVTYHIAQDYIVWHS
jgi:hypothetical protein